MISTPLHNATRAFGWLLYIAFSLGCVAPAGDDSDLAASTSAVSTQDLAADFAVDYGLGWLSTRPLRSLPRDRLNEVLPVGDARTYAACLGGRRDVVRGDTVRGFTWRHETRTYYVLEVDVDTAKLRDVQYAFVFEADGAARFQVLAWENKTNVQIVLQPGSPCRDRDDRP